jgi:asparagine synthase (glutamine-hydrolysing)
MIAATRRSEFAEIARWSGGPCVLGRDEPLPQSLCQGNRYVVVIDGFLTNRTEIAATLLRGGHSLPVHTDEALIAAAYAEWGTGCADKLLGEFAFAVWDRDRHELFAARDAIGTRVLYFCALPGRFRFASDLGRLAAACGSRHRLNEPFLVGLLVPPLDRDDQRSTVYQGLERLRAGHFVLVTARGHRVERYWFPERLSPLRFADLGECTQAYAEQLRLAVRARMGDEPLGALLSGGLDSSSILAFARELAPAASRIRTFSLVECDRSAGKDWQAIEALLADPRLDPTIVQPDTAPDVLHRHIHAISAAAQPFTAWNGYHATRALEAAAGAGCRVLFEGMGGDLHFYGPDATLKIIAQRMQYSFLPAFVRAHRHHGRPAAPGRWLWRLAAELAPSLLRYHYRRAKQLFGPQRLPGLLPSLLRPDVRGSFMRRHADEFPARDFDWRQPDGDIAFHADKFTSGLLATPHEELAELAASAGVSLRSPFSDRRLVEFALRMPPEAKMFLHWYKLLLRRMNDGRLPERVVWRRDIGQHPGPAFYAALLKHVERHEPELWNLENIQRALDPWIDPAALRRMWHKYSSVPTYDVGYHLLMLAILARWLHSQVRIGDA